MATPIGFEPTISTVTGWQVRPLHHGAVSQLFDSKGVSGVGQTWPIGHPMRAKRVSPLPRPLSRIGRGACVFHGPSLLRQLWGEVFAFYGGAFGVFGFDG